MRFGKNPRRLRTFASLDIKAARGIYREIDEGILTITC